jgi:hypothetical protein
MVIISRIIYHETPETTPEPSAVASAPVSDVQSDVVSDVQEQSELEESDTQPQPPEDGDEWTVRICLPLDPRPHEGAKPDWWTPAWETLNGILMRVDSPLLPVSPKDFKEAVDTGVYMVDQLGSQTRTDPVTGSEISPEEDPSLFTVVTGCVWNSQFATLVKYGNEGESSDSAILKLFEIALSLVPEGIDMKYDTHSDLLVEQWHDMMGWKASGYQGLDQNPSVPQWSGVMRMIEEENRQVCVVKLDEGSTASAILEASQCFSIRNSFQRKLLPEPCFHVIRL